MTFADYLPADEQLAEPPLFPVDERDRDPKSEHARQCEVVKACRSRGLTVFAIPNARAWGMKAWNKAVAEGVRWGAPDLVICGRGQTCFAEMKNGRAMPEQHQVECLNALHRMGFAVGVFRRADSVLAFLGERGFVGEARDAA